MGVGANAGDCGRRGCAGVAKPDSALGAACATKWVGLTDWSDSLCTDWSDRLPLRR